MLNLGHNHHDGPWKKSDLRTEGVSVDKIKGLAHAEHVSPQEIAARCERDTKDSYSHHEMYGTWCNVDGFIDVPVEYAFEYAANVHSLEEWTYSVRDLKHIGNGIYKGKELLAPPTEIFVRCDAFKDSYVVDYLCAWDQKEELWMRYYFRFIDARPTLNRPGTILTWLNCKHPYYDRKSANLPNWVKDSQNKKDRVWVGDHWRYFWAAHKIEADNLRYILEHRYHNKK
jgi:hypothetical protein